MLVKNDTNPVMVLSGDTPCIHEFTLRRPVPLPIGEPFVLRSNGRTVALGTVTEHGNVTYGYLWGRPVFRS